MSTETAAERVDYRLTYDRLPEPRRCHSGGIYGPDIPNAYYGRLGHEGSSDTGAGDWEDPDHPSYAPDEEQIARWFTTAIREAAHEACEWFWVDGDIYLDPHGDHENEIHQLSAEFAERLLSLRTKDGAA